jgi:Protein of unknown function (DUF992)
MGLKILGAAIVLGALAAGGSGALAQDRVKAGTLRCDISGGLGFIITSVREMECQFTGQDGHTERYWGKVQKFGLDIGGTTSGVLSWDVYAPTVGPRRGALAGEYAGITASATVGPGLGANALLGGSDRSVGLQPLSIQVQGGLNLSAGVASLTLHPDQ